MQNPYKPTRTVLTSTESNNRKGCLVGTFIASSCVVPLLNSFLLLDMVIGIEKMRAGKWVELGLVVSLVLNALFSIPYASTKIRAKALAYSVCHLFLTTLLSLLVIFLIVLSMVS